MVVPGGGKEPDIMKSIPHPSASGTALREGSLKRASIFGAHGLSPLREDGDRAAGRQLALSAHEYPKADAYYYVSPPSQRCRANVWGSYTPVRAGTCLRWTGLRDWHFGEWEGKTAEELQGDGPALPGMDGKRGRRRCAARTARAAWRVHAAGVPERLKNWWRACCAAAHGPPPVLVAQGGVLMAILSRLWTAAGRASTTGMTGNGCGYTLRITPACGCARWWRRWAAPLPHRETGEEEGDEALAGGPAGACTGQSRGTAARRKKASKKPLRRWLTGPGGFSYNTLSAIWLSIPKTCEGKKTDSGLLSESRRQVRGR